MNNLLKPKEFIAEFQKADNKTKAKMLTVWVYLEDMLQLVLESKAEESIYKNNRPEERLLEALRSKYENALKDPLPKGNHFDETFEDHYIPQIRHREVYSDMGEIDIDRYLEKHPKMFSEVITIEHERRAKTVIFEMGVNWNERYREDVAERFKKIYALASQAEGNGEPLRVIAAFGHNIRELDPIAPNAPYFRFFMVIKDYDDPIFPGIWGILRNNTSANYFINGIADFWEGTHEIVNGRVVKFSISAKDFPEDEIIVIDPQYCYWDFSEDITKIESQERG